MAFSLQVRAWAASIAIFLSVSVAVAQDSGADSPGDGVSERPRIGVALSGGGVKGFAHVGALRVIESVGLPVDAVAGTSMGSFIGGLYAIGYSVDQLDSLVRTEDWQVLFEEESPRRQQPLEYRLAEEGLLFSLPVRGGQVGLPRGLVEGHRISQMLARLFFPQWRTRDFRKLPIPFGAVAADLADGEGVLLTTGSLPQAIRASISIPSVFDPVVIDGRTLIDGGVTRNLPAQDARALGADAVICVDVGEPVLPVDSLRSLVSIMVQAVGFRMLESNRAQHRLCDVLIRPNVAGISALDFERTDDVIALGEIAARSASKELEALRDSLFGVGSRDTFPRPSFDRGPDSVLVTELVVEGVSSQQEAVLRRAMRLSLPGYYTVLDLEESIASAYRTQRFTTVTYSLDAGAPDEAGQISSVLVVSAAERRGDQVALGLRYDSDYRASILMRVSLTNLFGYNTRLIGNVRLGEVVRLSASLTTPLGVGPRALLFTNVESRRYPIDLFANGTRTSSLVANVVEASARAGGFLSRDITFAAGLRGELYDIDPRIAGTPGVSLDFLNERSGLVFADASLHTDTFDRISFASRGVRISAGSSISIAPLSSDTFGQHSLDTEIRVPIGPHVSVTARALAGRTVGATSPVHYRFYAGGVFPVETLWGRHVPLVGRELQSVAGPNIRAIWAGLQIEVRRDVFVGALWNAASATQRWVTSIDGEDFTTGMGISAGVRTAVGPVQAIVTSADIDGPFQLHLSVGHAF